VRIGRPRLAVVVNYSVEAAPKKKSRPEMLESLSFGFLAKTYQKRLAKRCSATELRVFCPGKWRAQAHTSDVPGSSDLI